jgi:hypothetical protein
VRNANRTTQKTAKPWAEKYLEDRAVDLDFAKRCGVKVYGERVMFPRIHPLTGNDLNASSTRHQTPPTDPKTGKAMKFTRRPGVGNVLYFPRCLDWKTAFSDTSIDLYVVESECSALALAQRGLYAIGTGGKDNVFMAGTKRQTLHEHFSLIKLRGRRVFLGFDGDMAINPQVRDSVEAAAKLFAEANQ